MSHIGAIVLSAGVWSAGLAAGGPPTGDAVGESQSNGTIPVLLLTGHNNHNWRYTCRVHEETLEATGRFDVTVSTNPPRVLEDAKALSQFAVIVLDYNDLHDPKRWGDAAEQNFVNAVRNGTGVVAIHSANNAFKGWAEYEAMMGVLWREGAGHGKIHEFEVRTLDASHPVMSGLPASFRTRDELYHGLTNTQNSPYKLLAAAMSAKDTGGSGKDEPMALALEFGKGRVFATPLGHVWVGDQGSKTSVHTPGFKALLARGTEWAATGSVTLPAEWKDVRAHNTLSKEEQDLGWRLLFDGTSLEHFRGFRKEGLPDKGWEVRDGMLRRPEGQGGGDLVTREQYGDFMFSLEWRAAKGANSGIIYRATEEFDFPWQTGPEMQILDDPNHRDGANPKTRAGTLYDILACAHDVVRPAGEWNRAMVIAKGTRLTHVLNGVVVVDIDTAGEEYKKAHAQSKWPGMPHFNTRLRGHIAIQDHGDVVEFRNIKVRPLE